MPRSTREVIESHLERQLDGNIDEDLRQNYSEDVLLLSAEGAHRGHDAIRAVAGLLKSSISEGSYEFDEILVGGQIGMLRWRGRGSDRTIFDGADSYLVRDGLITVQTIHYAKQPTAKRTNT